MRPATDLTGRTFGRLVVLRRHGSRFGRATWVCRCSCGMEKVIAGASLLDSCVRSCGCLRSETALARWRRSNAEAADKKRRLNIIYAKPQDLLPEDRPSGPLAVDPEAVRDLAAALGILC